MSSKAERRAARESVAAYHEARLAALVQRVGEAIDRLRAGELVPLTPTKSSSSTAERPWRYGSSATCPMRSSSLAGLKTAGPRRTGGTKARTCAD